MPSFGASCFRPSSGDIGESRRGPKKSNSNNINRQGQNSNNLNSSDHPTQNEAHQLVLATPIEGEIPEHLKGRVVVELSKLNRQLLGLTIAGGADKGYPARISRLRPGGLASKSDLLQLNDIIASINNVRTCRLNHSEIVRYFKNIEDQIYLEVEYELPPAILGEETNEIKQRFTTVSLVRDGMSFGFTIRGGHDNSSAEKSRPLVVTSVRANSPADRSGVMKPGDRITHIDNISLKGLTLAEALTRLATGEERAQFTIEYDISVVEAIEHANGPLIVEVLKTPGVELGLNLAILNRHSITIESVMPASVADRCGALHAGDDILAIDDHDAQHLTLPEALRMFRSNSERVKVKILPMRQASRRLAIEAGPMGIGYNNPPHGGYGYPNQNHSQGSMERLPGNGRNGLGSGGLSNGLSNNQLSMYNNQGGQGTFRTEHTEIELLTNEDTFGFEIQNAIFATDMFDQAPPIKEIHPGSAADIDGRLRIGDRLIAVNNTYTEESNLDDIQNIIQAAIFEGKITLLIEYDITEGIMASSGTFQVKLVKSPSVMDFGLELTFWGWIITYTYASYIDLYVISSMITSPSH